MFLPSNFQAYHYFSSYRFGLMQCMRTFLLFFNSKLSTLDRVPRLLYFNKFTLTYLLPISKNKAASRGCSLSSLYIMGTQCPKIPFWFGCRRGKFLRKKGARVENCHLRTYITRSGNTILKGASMCKLQRQSKALVMSIT